MDVRQGDRDAMRGDQALLDRQGSDTREHVAAIGPGVDWLRPDADLGEEVIPVATGLRGARDDGAPRDQRITAAHVVHLQQAAGADGRDRRLVMPALVGAQPFAQEEVPALGAGMHQDVAKGSGHGGDCTSLGATQSIATLRTLAVCTQFRWGTDRPHEPHSSR